MADSSAAIITDIGTSDVSEIEVKLSNHVSGDFLVVCVSSRDTVNFVQKTGTTGWVSRIEENANRTLSVWTKFATNSAEPLPTFETDDGSAGNQLTASCQTVSYVDTSTPIDASATRSQGTSTGDSYFYTLDAVTTTLSDTLAIQFHTEASIYYVAHGQTNLRMYAAGGDNAHSISVSGCYYQNSGLQQAVSLIRPRFSSQNPAVVQLVINNASGGKIKGQVDLSTTPSSIISTLNSSGSSDISSLVTSLDGNTPSSDSMGNGQQDSFYSYIGGGGFNYMAGSLLANETSDYTEIMKSVITVDTFDLSNSIVAWTIGPGGYNAFENYANGGIYLGFTNTSDAGAVLWKIAASDTKLKVASSIFPVIIDTTITDGREDFGTVDLTDVEKIVAAITVTSTASIQLGVPHKLNDFVMTYGTSLWPMSMVDYAEFAETCSLKTVQRQLNQTSGQFFVTHNLQCGNGTDETHSNYSRQAVAFPDAYSEAERDVAIRVVAGKFGMTVYASSDDSHDFSASSWYFGDSHKFTMHASTSTSAVYSFENCTLIKPNATFVPLGYDISGLTVISGLEFNHGGASFKGGCVFANNETAQVITITNKTDFENFQNCAFRNNELLSIKITGNHGGETWSALGMKVSGGQGSYDIEYTGTGTLIISVDSSSGITQGRATATGGGTLTISAPELAITLTGLQVGTDVVILTAGTDTVLDSVDQTSGTTFAYIYTAQDAIDIGIIKPGYVTLYIYNLTPGATSANLPIVQRPDRNYL
jgi:hypothetical protein